MSHYDWEHGTVIIPSAQWAAFKKALRDGYNLMREKDLETLTKIHAKVSESCKGMASSELYTKVENEVSRLENVSTWGGFKKAVYALNLLEPGDCQYMLVKPNEKTRKFQLVKPVSTKFPHPAADRNTTTFHVFDDARIVLNNTNRTVTWRVPEGNHAVQRASDSAMGRLFFGLLNKITWTRGSGGVFYRNDEENRSGSDGGDGLDYVAARFGPTAQAKGNIVRRY